MSNREYFYLSEIILGLREEYIKTRRELESLKENINFDDNYDASLGVYFSVPKDPNAELRRYLVIQLEEKASKLKKALNELTNKIKDRSFKQEISCDRNEIHNYILVNEGNRFDIDDDVYDFYQQCDKVIHTDLNLGAVDTYTKIEGQDMIFKVGHDGVFSCTNNNKRFAPNTGFDYSAFSDQLVLNNYYSNPAFIPAVKEVMETPIPRKIIDTRLAKIIENNPKSILPIKFEGLTNTKAPQYFNLIEEKEKVIALRVR